MTRAVSLKSPEKLTFRAGASRRIGQVGVEAMERTPNLAESLKH